MDPLSDILSVMRPSGYGFRGLDAGGEWALLFPPAEGLRCFAIEAGGCWLRLADDGTARRLDAGEVVLMAGGGEVLLYSSERASPLDAVAVLTAVPPGAIATVNGGGGCRGIGGFFGWRGPEASALLAAVPPFMHVRSDEGRAALLSGVRRLMRELSEPRPGGALLASHLAQALLVEALRATLEAGEADRGWFAALSIPTLRRAVEAMHADVARRWTLSDLAAVAGMSRSSFAAQFERATAETPIAYLTRWRMILAADLMATSNLSVPRIAASVGYESESAFGAAFKRVTGVSPRRYGRVGDGRSTEPDRVPAR